MLTRQNHIFEKRKKLFPENRDKSQNAKNYELQHLLYMPEKK